MFIFSIALVKLPTGPVKITGPVGMISPQKNDGKIHHAIHG